MIYSMPVLSVKSMFPLLFSVPSIFLSRTHSSCQKRTRQQVKMVKIILQSEKFLQCNLMRIYHYVSDSQSYRHIKWHTEWETDIKTPEWWTHGVKDSLSDRYKEWQSHRVVDRVTHLMTEWQIEWCLESRHRMTESQRQRVKDTQSFCLIDRQSKPGLHNRILKSYKIATTRF